jgi:hypothetical protein
LLLGALEEEKSKKQVLTAKKSPKGEINWIQFLLKVILVGDHHATVDSLPRLN